MAVKKVDNPATASVPGGPGELAAVGCWGGCWVSGCWGGCWPGLSADVDIREQVLKQLTELQDEVSEEKLEGEQALQLLTKARRLAKRTSY